MVAFVCYEVYLAFDTQISGQENNVRTDLIFFPLVLFILIAISVYQFFRNRK